MKIPYLLCAYLIFMNLFSFFLMGLDKWKARRKKWRIPEKTLFLFAFLGGSLGSLAGMQVFRHKTRHTSFRIGMPCILIFHILLAAFLTQKITINPYLP